MRSAHPSSSPCETRPHSDRIQRCLCPPVCSIRRSPAQTQPREPQPVPCSSSSTPLVETQQQGAGSRRNGCRLYDLHDTLVPYQQAWDWQHRLVADAIHRPPASSSHRPSTDQQQAGTFGPRDSVLLLQHPPVFTLGAGSAESNLLFDPSTSAAPLYRTERGGEVTYHGPGQLVMYPILNLQRHPYRADLHWYLRSLEQVVIRALEEAAGLEGERVDGMTGVWVAGHKVAAIGVRAKKWVTYHGLALNVVTDLQPFRSIVPCGIPDKPVGSVRSMLESMSMVHDPFLSDVGPDGGGVQSGRQLLREFRFALTAAFEEVFDVELQEADAAADLPGARALLRQSSSADS